MTNAGRILGGENANLNEIPWQLLMKEPRGGASLISDRWAVTAAHVVDESDTATLVLYGGLVDARNAQKPSVVAIRAEEIIIHPDYTKGTDHEERTNYDHDIALIRFTSRVELGPSLLPICLPDASNSFVENEQGSISGWGLNDRDRISAMLKHASVAVSPLRQCEDTPVLSNGMHGVFTSNMFCAGTEGKDSCLGDSGGPFILPVLGSGNKQNRGPYRLTGIVSWGPPCAQKKYMGYYTKVENYVDWILETIDNREKANR